jgi:uncharacterized membrane protein YgcG
MILLVGTAARRWAAGAVLGVTAMSAPGVASGAEPIGGIPDPRGRGAWVADAAGVIPDDAETRMNARIGALHEVRGPGVIVVTANVAPAAATGAAQGTAAFAKSVLNGWKPGHRGAGDGVVVALVVADRSVEVASGKELKVALPVGAIRRLVIERLRPYAQRRAFADAAETAVDWVVARLEQELRELPASLPESARRSPVNTRTILLASGAIGVVLGLALAGLRGADFLERPGCPSCGRRSVVQLKQILLAPTAEVEGVEVIEDRCQGCRWTRRQQKAIPRLPASEEPGSSVSTRVERTLSGTRAGERRARRERRRDEDRETEADVPSVTASVGGPDSLTAALPRPAAADDATEADAGPGASGDPDSNPFKVPEHLAEAPDKEGGDR